jgi:hypothetical protein
MDCVSGFRAATFLLGPASLLKLMFLGWPKRSVSSRLLLAGAMSNDGLVRAPELRLELLLSRGLFVVGYGSTLVTLQRKGYKDTLKKLRKNYL